METSSRLGPVEISFILNRVYIHNFMPEHYVIKHVTETSIVTIKINTMIDLNKSIAVLFIIYEIVG